MNQIEEYDTQKIVVIHFQIIILIMNQMDCLLLSAIKKATFFGNVNLVFFTVL